MSFIVTSLRPTDIVITSDSRATLEKADRITGFSDTCQKIFPIPDHPLVIAHHGENDLGGKPLPQFIADFVSGLNAGNLTVLDTADLFRTYAHPAIRARIRALPAAGHGCGFIFAGFGAEDRGPMAVELFWKKVDNALVTEERQWSPTAVIPSGDGAPQADKVDWHQIADVPVESVRKYNEHLIDEAIHATVAQNTVGGPLQEVIVRREKWEWTMEPPKPAPGARGDQK